MNNFIIIVTARNYVNIFVSYIVSGTALDQKRSSAQAAKMASKLLFGPFCPTSTPEDGGSAAEELCSSRLAPSLDSFKKLRGADS